MEKISVIVPVKDSALILDKCLGSTLACGYDNLEIIIVDDGLDKNCLELLGQFCGRIKILKSNSRGPSYARNLAARNTDAEFIAFTDSDCIVDKDWLKELLRGFEEFPEAVSCGGRQELPEDATRFEKKVFLFMKKTGFITDYMRRVDKDEIIEVGHNASCNVMYKRDVFLKEEGFLEGLWPGEDVELDYRLKKKGYKLAFNPKAVVYHYRPKNLKLFLGMMHRYGWAQGFLVRKYGIFRKVHLFALLSLLSLPLFTLILSSNLLFLLSLGAIFLTLFSFSNFDPYLVLLKIISFFSWNVGFWLGFLKRKK